MQLNVANCGGYLEMCRAVTPGTAKVAFVDPQYRGVLDKLDYGNEGARQKGRAALPQMSEDCIGHMLALTQRSLCPSGYLFLWVDKFMLCTGLPEISGMEVVDLITWDKQRIGMGYRSRRRSEYLVVYQNLPKRAKGTWTIKNIPDVWCEALGADRKKHAHRKPKALVARLIEATTNPGDLIIDPCAGSFLTLDVGKTLGRKVMSTDISEGVVSQYVASQVESIQPLPARRKRAKTASPKPAQQKSARPKPRRKLAA